MMKSKSCGGDGDFKFIKEFVKKGELKVRAEVKELNFHSLSCDEL